MAQCHRLRDLEMGEARNHARGMLFGPRQQRVLQRAERGIGQIDRVAHPQAEIGRDLVVARARGVEPPRRRADHFGEPVLHRHVDVLERDVLRNAPHVVFEAKLVERKADNSGIVG